MQKPLSGLLGEQGPRKSLMASGGSGIPSTVPSPRAACGETALRGSDSRIKDTYLSRNQTLRCRPPPFILENSSELRSRLHTFTSGVNLHEFFNLSVPSSMHGDDPSTLVLGLLSRVRGRLKHGRLL